MSKYEYKVLSQQDHLSGVFEARKLEETLNLYAKDGWRVVTTTSGAIVDVSSVRDEVIIILE
ncbi:MAG: DUF4177 domain-containing protein [bacterium]|nr:DUF4177 domain-containing protein [bacterium]